MVTALDVEPNKLIAKTAEKLKAMKLEKPAFVGYVKASTYNERPPQDSNFWFIRCASLLRQVYMRGNIGVNRMRSHYSGKKRRGVKPNIRHKAGGKTIRKSLQALEKVGLIKKQKKGRELSPKGRKFLDSIAKEIS